MSEENNCTRQVAELKNCPFCGGEPAMKVGISSGQDMNRKRFYGYVKCEECEATLGMSWEYGDISKMIAEAVAEKWNRRSMLEASKERTGANEQERTDRPAAEHQA